jgi:hypothetical protein
MATQLNTQTSNSPSPGATVPTGASAATELPHLLSLKVLRLSKPSIVINTPILIENQKEDAPTRGLEMVANADPTSLYADYTHVQPHAGFPDKIMAKAMGVSQLLTLPANFGNIYLGETFTSYLSLFNDTKDSITTGSAIKVELQTATQRFTLADTSETDSMQALVKSSQVGLRINTRNGKSDGLLTLEPRDSMELVVQHDIKELGVHILVCTVQYGTPLGEKRFFRKFYKFQVLNPLAVRTKVSSLQDGKVLLEVQVQNMTTANMFFEAMKFEPNDPFTCTDLNYLQGTPPNPFIPLTQPDIDHQLAAVSLNPLDSIGRHPLEVGGHAKVPGVFSVFGTDGLLQPQDVRQYLYLLQPISSESSSVAQLGKLDISWTTPFGETGRLQTSQLVRKVPPTEPLDAQVSHVPNDVVLERPFSCKILLRNNTPAETMKVTVQGVTSKTAGILWCGSTCKFIGDLAPGETREVSLDFLPVQLGLHKIASLKLVDLSSGFTKDTDLSEVYVSAI